MNNSAVVVSTAVIAICLATPYGHAQNIERIKLSDGEMNCRQMYTEIGEMDRAIAEAKKAQDSGSATATAGQVGNAAAEVANRTGLFGQIGGLFGQIAGSVAARTAAGVTEQSGRQSAQQAAEREKQAFARKEHVATLFNNKGCKLTDLDAPPANPNAPVLALAQPSAQAPQQSLPPAELVAQVAAAISPATGRIDFDRNQVAVAASSQRVIVPTFRVAFTIKTQAAAYAGGGLANIGQSTGFNRTITQAQNKRVEMALAGADLPLLQALTDRLFADFLSRLRESGREVISQEVVAKTPGFEKLKQVEKRPHPSSPSTQGDPREYLVLAPTNLPLFFMHLDTYIGNTGAFDQDSTKAVAELAARLSAVAFMPTLHIDIAELQSSGRSSFASGAEAEVIPKLGVGARSELRYMNGKDVKIFFTGDMGSVSAKAPIYSEGEFGSMATVQNYDTAGLANALTRLSGTQGVQNFLEKRELRVDSRRFAQGVLNVGAAFHQQAIAAVKP